MPAEGPKRFPIRVDKWFRFLFVLLGGNPKHAYVEVDGERLRVQLGWMFRTESFHRSAVRSVGRRDDIKSWFPGIGAHGGRGHWLVNGSTTGLVRLEIEPHEARLYRLFPAKVHTLSVSLEDPEAFLEEVGG